MPPFTSAYRRQSPNGIRMTRSTLRSAAGPHRIPGSEPQAEFRTVRRTDPPENSPSRRIRISCLDLAASAALRILAPRHSRVKLGDGARPDRFCPE
jgi:hypothetical protein